MRVNKILTYSGVIAMLLTFFTAAGGTLSSIYSNTLFLSSYPAGWLAFFLVTQAIVNTLSSFALTPLLAGNHIKRNSILLLNVSTIIILGIFFFSRIHYFWFPFIIAITIGLISSILTVIGWNVITLAFGMREYKRIIIYINQIATLGATIGGLQAPMLLSYFSLHSLLLPLIVFLLGSSVMTYFLPFIEENQPRLGEGDGKHKPLSPLRFSLYRNVLYFSIVMIAIQAFIEYAFKFQIAQHYTNQQIGIFMGYFMSITNVLGFLVALTITKRFLQLFLLDGLLYATPIFTFLSCIVVLFMPALWSICVLASTKSLFYYNHTRLGMEISLNILPSSSRITGKSQLKYVVSPLANVISFLLLLVLAETINIQGIVLIIALLCAICFYLVKQISQSYKDTLQQETEFRRFNLIDKINPATEKFFKDTLLNELKKTQDVNLILFYLNVLKKFRNITLPITLYKQLGNPSFLIRRAIIKFIKRNKDVNSLNYLLQQFRVETDPEIRCFLFDTIRSLSLDEALKIVQEYKNDINNPIYPDILGILFDLNQQSQRAYALAELRKLSFHQDPFIRKETGYLIGYYRIVELEAELGSLIADPDNDVCKTAIKAAANAQMIALTPAIIKRLVPGPWAHAAQTALIKLGSQVLPILLQYIIHDQKNKILYIRVMAKISGLTSDREILKFANEKDIYLRTQIAKEANYRACHQTVSDEFKAQAKQLALQETYSVAYLEDLTTQYSIPHLAVEIAARIKLAKMRALLWIGAATDPALMNKLIPSLLTSKTSPLYQKAQSEALELLEIVITDMKIKKQMIGLFEQQNVTETAEGSHGISKDTIYEDSWLERIIKLETSSEGSENMDVLLKAFELRAIELFKDLPSEILLAIAEETKEKSYNEGDVIFHENDFPDGLYCISSGKVKIIRHGKLLNTLATHDFFGELALIDDSVRSASAVADSDCTLLLLEKSTFDRITDDLPEVLRGVTKVLLYYLRQHMELYKE